MSFIKKTVFILIICLFNFVSAKSFSLQVIQKNGSETVVFDASYLIEQTIMDYFFENSYIVSNSPVIIQKKDSNIKVELQKTFDSAQEGSLDFVIETVVFYNLSDSNNSEEAQLNNIDKIEWKVVLLSDKNVIASGNCVPKNYRNDEDGLISFSYEIAKNIKKEIETKGGLK